MNQVLSGLAGFCFIAAACMSDDMASIVRCSIIGGAFIIVAAIEGTQRH